MARRPAAPPKGRGEPRAASMPHKRNPRNIPLPQLDASPPQPPVPEPSPIAEEEQDSEPLNPAPLLNPACDPVLPPRERKNG